VFFVVISYPVVVVVVIVTFGNASMGGQIPRKDEEFPMVLILDKSGVSISPSWCLTAI